MNPNDIYLIKELLRGKKNERLHRCYNQGESS